jgi:hypothetical protein
MSLRKFFLYTLIVSVVVSALIGIGVILFGEFGEFEARVLMTTSTITVTSILGLACGALFELGRARVLPVSGIVLSVVACVLCVVMIWWRDPYNQNLGKTTLTAVMLATACAHLSLISLAWLDARFKWSFYSLWATDWVLNAILLYILWFEPESSSDMIARVIGVLSIIIAALTIMTPVFHKLSKKPIETADGIDAEIADLRAKIEELERRRAALV